MPGAFTPLSARLIERAGFAGVYVSGAVMSAELGLPDIGLTTLTEVAQRSGQIARVTDVPVLVDADTGFGEPLNVARTVHVLEDAGVAALHLEDQVNPKRCGHLDGKSVVDRESARRRIAAAVRARRDPDLVVVARSDALAVEGFSSMLERLKAYVDAGADAVFPEAVTSLEEYERIRETLGVPVLANMTEFGKSELFRADQLASAGVSIAIYPVSLLRISMGVIERALASLVEEGSLQSWVPQMQTRADLYEVLDYSAYDAYDEGIFNFEV
jgi:methylisocitrate lyase